MNEQSKPVVRGIYTVKRREALTPHYIRVTLEIKEEQLGALRQVTVGANNKIFIPPAGTREIIFPDREHPTATVDAAVVRTYTTRRIDFAQKELVIDFVAHGDNGPASAWALRAAPGDPLGVAMKAGSKPLIAPAERYVLVGDATALPVIGAILERLPQSAKATVILEVHGVDDELQLHSPADVRIQWLHNPHPESGSGLTEAVKRAVAGEPAEGQYVHIAAEYRTVKALRTFFREERGLHSGSISASSYWKSGESEQESISARRAERSS